MNAEGVSVFRRKGCLVAGWGCLLPVALVVLSLSRPSGWAVLLATPFLAYLLLRLITLSWVEAAMRRAAGRVYLPPPAAVEPVPPPAVSLRFLNHDEAHEIRLEPDRAAHLQLAAAAGRSTWLLFRRTCVAVLLSLFGVAVAWTLLLPLGLPGERGLIWIFWFLLNVQVGLLFAITAATFASLQRVPAGFPLAYVVIAGVGLGWMQLGAGPIAYAYLAILAIGVWMMTRGYRELRRRLIERGGDPLLILRVFGSDANTAFLFGEIVRRWCFLGNVATIVDASYVRFQGSLAARENRRYLVLWSVAFFACVGLVATVGDLPFEPFTSPYFAAMSYSFGWVGRAELVAIVACLVIGLVFLLWLARRVRRNFSRALARLGEGAGEAEVESGGVYSKFALYCHDDVWKPTVAALLATSRVVLMDLRGFSPERKGCEYELGLLIDHFPVDRILLVTDKGANLAPLEALIRERWARMRGDSPNRSLTDPVLASYSPGVEDPGDVQRILALLARMLPPAPPVAGRAGEALVIPAVAAAAAGQPKLEWAERLGRLDLRVSSPSFAGKAIAAFLAVLALDVWLVSEPVAEAHRVFAAPSIRPISSQAPSPPAADNLGPVAISGRVKVGKPTLQLNKGFLSEWVEVCVRLDAGAISAKWRLAAVRDIEVLGPEGEPMALTGEASFNTAPGDLELCVTVSPRSMIQSITAISGKAIIEPVDSEGEIFDQPLDSLAPEPGWYRLSHPAIDAAGSLELLRFTSDDWVDIRQKGDLDLLPVKALDANGEDGAAISWGSRELHYWRQTVAFEKLEGARLEISSGVAARREVEFQVKDLPVAQPSRPQLDRFFDRLKGQSYEEG